MHLEGMIVQTWSLQSRLLVDALVGHDHAHLGDIIDCVSKYM